MSNRPSCMCALVAGHKSLINRYFRPITPNSSNLRCLHTARPFPKESAKVTACRICRISKAIEVGTEVTDLFHRPPPRPARRHRSIAGTASAHSALAGFKGGRLGPPRRRARAPPRRGTRFQPRGRHRLTRPSATTARLSPILPMLEKGRSHRPLRIRLSHGCEPGHLLPGRPAQSPRRVPPIARRTARAGQAETPDNLAGPRRERTAHSGYTARTRTTASST